jgi:DNA polymerase-3 subunit alpha (Gram-positive type)
MHDLIRDPQFQNLEKEYKFLARARGETLSDLECIIVDIETTGLEPTQHEITEIGALKIKGSDIKDVFNQLIKPKKTIPPNITKLTGIDNDMVKDSPPAEVVLPKFFEFIGNQALIAHNSDFDIPFIKYHMRQSAGKELNNPVGCTLKLSRFLLPGLANHKLHTVASHLGLTVANRHRAMGDVELTFQVWVKFIELLKGKGINNWHGLTHVF